MMEELAELAWIVGRGIAKAAGFRRHEKPESFEAAQSIVAAVIAVAVVAVGLVLLLGWLLTR